MSGNFSINNPLKIINFASFLQYQRFIMPVSFLFYLYNGLTFSDFILFQSIFNITCLVTKIPIGFLGDIFSRKHILIFSYFLFLLRVVLWLSFQGFWVILAGEILYGLFKALYRGNVDSYIYEWLKYNGAEKNMLPDYGKLTFYTSIGSALSCLAGAALYKYSNFKFMLVTELVLQILAFVLLFFIPDISTKRKRLAPDYYLKSLSKSITSVITNSRINYYVYYSAMLTGLTGVFVWNFQPLLKASGAPVLLYGLTSFINQVFRALGGLKAKSFISKFSGKQLFITEYLCVLISFLLLLIVCFSGNYIKVTGAVIFVCVAIFTFVIFNLYTVSKIHENCRNFNRAATSSSNTFFGDFASFALLLLFKFSYDLCGLEKSLLLFLFLSAAALLPNFKIIGKSS